MMKLYQLLKVFDPGLNIIVKCKGQGTYVTIFDGMVCEVPWSIALTTIDAGAEGGLNHDWDNHKVFVYVKEK